MYTHHTSTVLHNQTDASSPEDVLDIKRQAIWIEQIVQGKGYKTLRVPFSLEKFSMLASLNRENPLLVYNLVDSEENLAYLVPGILEHMGLPYIRGAPYRTCSLLPIRCWPSGCCKLLVLLPRLGSVETKLRPYRTAPSSAISSSQSLKMPP